MWYEILITRTLVYEFDFTEELFWLDLLEESVHQFVRIELSCIVGQLISLFRIWIDREDSAGCCG